MKIGIIMIGHLRNYYLENFRILKLNLLKSLSNHSVNIYIHTWNKISLENNTKVELEKIKNLYNTNNIIIEEQNVNMIKDLKLSNKSICYQIYALKRILDEYRCELFKEDYIIKLRPDIRLRIPIEIKFNNKINFYETNLKGGCDVFFYGKSFLMINGINLYENIKLINDIKGLKKPELIYQEYWRKLKIDYEKNKLKFLKVINILR